MDAGTPALLGAQAPGPRGSAAVIGRRDSYTVAGRRPAVATSRLPRGIAALLRALRQTAGNSSTHGADRTGRGAGTRPGNAGETASGWPDIAAGLIIAAINLWAAIEIIGQAARELRPHSIGRD
ncbi:MAG: hypothetical protein GEU87_18095 [Alphaproteobacteria bacterium]|nr:hypothetical protein [Alphaproteobacteria bacterium]